MTMFITMCSLLINVCNPAIYKNYDHVHYFLFTKTMYEKGFSNSESEPAFTFKSIFSL